LGKLMIFSLKRREEIRFWYDFNKATFYVQHIPSSTIELIENPKKIEDFLGAYNLQLRECKVIREDEDKLGIFMKMKIATKTKSS
jgi:hypothetical protein